MSMARLTGRHDFCALDVLWNARYAGRGGSGFQPGIPSRSGRAVALAGRGMTRRQEKKPREYRRPAGFSSCRRQEAGGFDGQAVSSRRTDRRRRNRPVIRAIRKNLAGALRRLAHFNFFHGAFSMMIRRPHSSWWWINGPRLAGE